MRWRWRDEHRPGGRQNLRRQWRQVDSRQLPCSTLTPVSTSTPTRRVDINSACPVHQLPCRIPNPEPTPVPTPTPTPNPTPSTAPQISISTQPDVWLQTGLNSAGYWMHDGVWGAGNLTRGTYTGLNGSQYEQKVGVSNQMGPNGEVAARMAEVAHRHHGNQELPFPPGWQQAWLPERLDHPWRLPGSPVGRHELSGVPARARRLARSSPCSCRSPRSSRPLPTSTTRPRAATATCPMTSGCK